MQKVYRLIIIGVLMSALGSLGLSAQIKGYNIVVSVTPDHHELELQGRRESQLYGKCKEEWYSLEQREGRL